MAFRGAKGADQSVWFASLQELHFIIRQVCTPKFVRIFAGWLRKFCSAISFDVGVCKPKIDFHETGWGDFESRKRGDLFVQKNTIQKVLLLMQGILSSPAISRFWSWLRSLYLYGYTGEISRAFELCSKLFHHHLELVLNGSGIGKTTRKLRTAHPKKFAKCLYSAFASFSSFFV